MEKKMDSSLSSSEKASLGAPEEQPEWLLRCLAEVKEELRQDLLASMTSSTLRLKLKGDTSSKGSSSTSAAAQHLTEAIQSGKLRLNPGGGPKIAKERGVRKDLQHYERHCALADCAETGLGSHSNGRHPILLLPKSMAEETKRDLLAALIQVSRSSSSSTPSTRPDLWSIPQGEETEQPQQPEPEPQPPSPQDSDSGDDFSIVAEEDLSGYEVQSDTTATPEEEAKHSLPQLTEFTKEQLNEAVRKCLEQQQVQASTDPLLKDMTEEAAAEVEETKTGEEVGDSVVLVEMEAVEKEKETPMEEEEKEAAEVVDVAAEEREAAALAEVQAAMARLRSLNKAEDESLVAITPPPSMDTSITASAYVAEHRPTPQSSLPPQPPAELYLSAHDGLAESEPPEVEVETEVKVPVEDGLQQRPQSQSQSEIPPAKAQGVQASASKEALDTLLGNALKAASNAVGTAERTVSSAVEAVGSAIDSAFTRNPSSGAKANPSSGPRKWSPSQPAWVPNATQTPWSPPPQWQPPSHSPSSHIFDGTFAPDTPTETHPERRRYSEEEEETPVEPRFAEAMDTLISMGFADVEKNAALLRVHGNNLNTIVDTLLTDFNVIN